MRGKIVSLNFSEGERFKKKISPGCVAQLFGLPPGPQEITSSSPGQERLPRLQAGYPVVVGVGGWERHAGDSELSH